MSGFDLAALRVLVVDDQGTMRSIIRKLLATIGIVDSHEAQSGAAALAFLRNAKTRDPDVILCDLHMEDMDGMDFCNAVRRDEELRNRHIPIVILTGETDEFIHEVAQQVGAQKVLTKPISAPDLGRELAAVIGFAADGGDEPVVQSDPTGGLLACSVA